MLLSYFVDDKSAKEFLYNGGPASTFSSRINLCFLLGLISKNTRDDINIIRKIRNEFAHSHKRISFETESVSQRCHSLSTAIPHTGSTPRQKYISSVMGLLGIIEAQTYMTKHKKIMTESIQLYSAVEEFWQSIHDD